jgi:hypothetical protein
LKPQPCREREQSNDLACRLGDIQYGESEQSGLQNERERPKALFERMLIPIPTQSGIADHMASNPQQAREINACGRRRCRIEHIERVDERDVFVPSGRRSKRLQHQARPTRGPRPHELRQMAARKSAAQSAIDARAAERGHRKLVMGVDRRQNGRKGPIEFPRTKERLKIRTSKRHC